MNKKARSNITLKPKAPFKRVFMDVIPSTAPKSLTSDTTFSNYLLIVDAYSKIPKIYGMEKITTEEVMEKLDMFQSRFGKIDQFGWWDLERISVDAGKKFTLTEFKDECQNRRVRLALSALEHQEMNEQVEVTWRMLRTVAHYINVYNRSYISGSTNQRSYKQGWQFNNATQTGNRYETFSVSFTPVILSMCCT